MKRLVEYFESIGMNQHEAKLYYSLLELGESNVKHLALHAGMQRASAHFFIESLIEKGLIVQKKSGARRVLLPSNISVLESMVNQKKTETDKLVKEFPDISNVISLVKPNTKEGSSIDIRYFRGKKGIQSVYDEILKAEKIYSFGNLENYYRLFPNTRNNWIDALKKKTKREIWDLLVDTPAAREILKNKHKRYHIKFLPSSKTLEGFEFVDYIIYDNKVAIIQLDLTVPEATTIQSKHIAMSLKSLHLYMWEALPAL